VHRDSGVYGLDMVKAINSYRIALNRSIRNDVNYRVFETLGCKTLLLTNHVPDLGRLFTKDRHLLTYGSPAELASKAQEILRSPTLMETIATAGYQHTLAHHTYHARAQLLLSFIHSYR
jgi:spore maturation protein CgeB